MEKILDKVKKLLAVANNEAATEGERDNALRMAHNMLAKHNLAMADLDEHNKLEGRDEMLLETFQMKWCCHVAHNVAKLFFCSYYSGQKINATKGTHYFVGKESNAVTAMLMTEYIIKSILKECRTRWGHNLAPESRSFSLGASAKIAERVRHMLANVDTMEGVNAANALIIHDLYRTEADANEAFIKSRGVLLVTKKTKQSSVNSAAYNSGKEFGNGISLNGQVANKSNLRLN